MPHRRKPSLLAALLTVVTVTASLAALPPASVAAAPPDETPDLTVTAWATGITDPWDVAFLPDGTALITEKTTGIVHVRHRDGSLTEVEADQRDFLAAGEGGLLGIAVDPDFDRNGRYYTCQNSTARDVRVIRWRLSADRSRASRQRVLVDGIPMSSGRHSGCRLAFGHEGHLFVTTGDAAIGRTPRDRRSLGGKVLRIDPTTGNGVPGNPFFTTAGADRSKIYTYGHRNPQGIARRPCTDQMWTAEHGPDVDDEINLLRRGADHGWNPVPGYNESVPMTDTSLPGPQRRARWRSGRPTIAISGIGWIRGADWGGWDGELAGATLKNSQLWVFEFSNRNRLTDTDRPAELDRTRGRLRVPVAGPDGSLYVASQSNGAVYRVTPDRGPEPGSQDVDGDGFDDLVVGAPGEAVGNRSGAGRFNVLYGSASGLAPANGTQQRDQRHLDGSGAEAGDGLASAVAYGDVDGDGTTDVGLGSPGETLSGQRDAGAVHVVCGRTDGIQRRSSQTFSQSGSVAGRPENGDELGGAVVLGDFDGDGLDDLVAGAAGETVGGQRASGAITVLYATPSGLTTEHSVQFSQAGPVAGADDAADRFGAALAAGDFDGDGFDDLAVGAPGERFPGAASSGTVTVLRGSPTGLVATGSRVFDQSSLPGGNEAGDRFGAALAAGDLDGDGDDDLAVGAPGETVDGQGSAGAVTVLFGGPGGLVDAGAQFLTQGAAAPGENEGGDAFGSALATGDIDGDDRADLVVGSRGEDNGRGRIVIFAGSPTGLGTPGTSFDQRGAVPGRAEPGADMGAALRLADFDADGFADVAVGVPGQRVRGNAGAGAVVVLRGSSGGVTLDGARGVTQASAGVPGRPGAGDRFGAAL